MNEPHTAFLLGCPRSGTTLVQQIVSTSNEVHTIRETHLIHKARYLESKNFLKRIFSLLLINIASFKLGLKEFFFTIEKKKFFAKLNACFLKEAKLANKRIFLEKTPRHLYYFNQLNENFPNSKFIFVLRNPIDNAKSLLSASSQWNEFLIDYSIENAYSRWLYDFNLILNYKNNPNAVVVYYDKLTHEKHYQDEIKKIENLLGIKIDIHNLLKSSNQIIEQKETWKKNNFSETIRFQNSLKKYQLIEALTEELNKIDEL